MPDRTVDWDATYASGGAWEIEHGNFARRVKDYVAQPKAYESGFVARASVLDVGCGSGRHLEFLASEGFFVAGLEPNGIAVEKARRRFDGFVSQGVCESIPWGNGCFDAVLSMSVLHFCEDPERAAREMQRVVKPRGYIFLSADLDLRRADVVEPFLRGEDVVRYFNLCNVEWQERGVKNIRAGSCPHPGDHAHEYVKFVFRKVRPESGF
ncbi:class I SAM-dependent methyltransferase [Candidatus Woesearchaeota archaeon]|nr:class I SAM-dependent methyltransferase [Candidatus Woesearchaeota archaeon]